MLPKLIACYAVVQHCLHGDLTSVSCVLLHCWQLSHTVHENRKSTCDHFVTLAAAVLSGPIIA